jgi:hypothetical protein
MQSNNQTRCGAWCHGRKKRCTQWPVRGGRRCHYHGGASTGPRTPEGLERALQAAWNGYARYLSTLKATGEKRPSGRRKGRAWRTKKWWANRMVDLLNAPPEMAAKVAAELVEHLKEKQIGEELIKRIEEIKQRPGFECEEIKGEIKHDK